RSVAVLRCDHATIDESVEARYVVNCVAGGSKGVEATRKVVSKIVESLPANICPRFDVVITCQRGQVVNELIVSLIPLKRKSTGVTDNRSRDRNWICKANNRRVVAGSDIDQRRSKT